MKNDTLLTVGALGLGGYALYRLLSPVEKTAEQIGGGIGTAFQETGSAVGEIAQGVSSPFDYMNTAINNAAKSRALKSDIARRGYEAAAPYTIAATVSKAKSKSLKQDKKTQIVEQSYNTQVEAQMNNYKEQVQRKTEYGSTAKEFLAKTFMPTNEQAQIRRTNAANTVKAIVNAPIVAAKNTTAAVISKLNAAASKVVTKAKSIKKSR